MSRCLEIVEGWLSQLTSFKIIAIDRDEMLHDGPNQPFIFGYRYNLQGA